MRIAFLGNFGVEYSSETHHKKSLESLGHTVLALQETQASSELILMEAHRSDMFVWVHTHGWATPGKLPMRKVLQKLKQLGIPTVTYHLDLWLGLQRQRDLNRDPVYKDIEHFFTVDKQMADWFEANTSVKGHYLPAGVYHEECASPMEVHATVPDGKPVRHNDVIFVGSRGYHPEWPWRPQLINWLQKTYGDKFRHIGGDGEGVVRGWDLTNLYHNTKVVVGDSLVKNFDYPYYWSDRLYETVGRGGFILFPYITGLEDEFEINDPAKIELVCYKFGDFQDIQDKIDYYLEHDEERAQIAYRGYQRVVNNYTYKHRWQTIIDTIGLNGK